MRSSGAPLSRRSHCTAGAGLANGSADAKRVAATIARGKPDRFLYLGDVYPVGTAAAFRSAYDPVYRRLNARTDPTPGNHDWGVHAQGYSPYWRSKLGHSVGSCARPRPPP